MSEAPQLSIGSWFSRGWKTYKRSPIQVIGGSVIWYVLFVFPSLPLIIKLIPIETVEKPQKSGVIINLTIC